ncbi:hypothetical protein ACLKA6_002273 [Drosophila palustris]
MSNFESEASCLDFGLYSHGVPVRGGVGQLGAGSGFLLLLFEACLDARRWQISYSRSRSQQLLPLLLDPQSATRPGIVRKFGKEQKQATPAASSSTASEYEILTCGRYDNTSIRSHLICQNCQIIAVGNPENYECNQINIVSLLAKMRRKGNNKSNSISISISYSGNAPPKHRTTAPQHHRTDED